MKSLHSAAKQKSKNKRAILKNAKCVIPFTQDVGHAVAALPVSVQLIEVGAWRVNFCGNEQIVKSGTIKFRADGKLDVETEY